MADQQRRDGAVVYRFDETVAHLRDVLAQYRGELQKSEDAFHDWKVHWDAQEQEIEEHLQFIQSRLSSRPQPPVLSIVRPDE